MSSTARLPAAVIGSRHRRAKRCRYRLQPRNPHELGFGVLGLLAEQRREGWRLGKRLLALVGDALEIRPRGRHRLRQLSEGQLQAQLVQILMQVLVGVQRRDALPDFLERVLFWLQFVPEVPGQRKLQQRLEIFQGAGDLVLGLRQADKRLRPGLDDQLADLFPRDRDQDVGQKPALGAFGLELIQRLGQLDGARVVLAAVDIEDIVAGRRPDDVYDIFFRQHFADRFDGLLAEFWHGRHGFQFLTLSGTKRVAKTVGFDALTDQLDRHTLIVGRIDPGGVAGVMQRHQIPIHREHR